MARSLGWLLALVARAIAGRADLDSAAATYPRALAAAVPAVMHRTGRYRTNSVERDHGFLKERLRPMRGLKSVAAAAIFMRGHALVRNTRPEASASAPSPRRSTRR